VAVAVVVVVVVVVVVGGVGGWLVMKVIHMQSNVIRSEFIVHSR
jgi:hypothetical protein